MIARKIESRLLSALHGDDILLLTGARQTGKTTLLKKVQQHLAKENRPNHLFTLEDPTLLAHLNEHPDQIFNYIAKSTERTFLLLDEIQYLKNPSNFLKYHYDLHRDWLKLIVTGSSAFYIDQKFTDSLAGRKKIFPISPFSFSEFLRAKEEHGLADRIDDQDPGITAQKWLIPEQRQLESYWMEYARFGGYPKVVLADKEQDKIEILRELFSSFLKKDVAESGINNEEKFYQFLRIVAGQCGQLLNLNEIANTLRTSRDTIGKYLYILEKSFIARRCPPFHRNLRKELTKMPKIYLLDNGYRNALLNIFAACNDQLPDGYALENILYSEMVKKGISDIRFWRTQSQHEVDFIVDEKLAIEVKCTPTAFSPSKYKKFKTSYPGIPLHLATHRGGPDLNAIDFTS